MVSIPAKHDYIFVKQRIVNTENKEKTNNRGLKLGFFLKLIQFLSKFTFRQEYETAAMATLSDSGKAWESVKLHVIGTMYFQI